MKLVMKYLSLLLCLELVVAPLNRSLLFSNKANAQDTSCPAGQTYSSTVNRCQTSQEVVNANNAADACRSLTDEQAKRDCYETNANNSLASLRAAELARCEAMEDGKDKRQCLRTAEERSNTFMSEDGGMNWAGGLTSAATIAVPLFFLIKTMADKQKRGSRCRPASLVLMYGAGAALLVGEVVSFIQHKRNLDKMDEARKALVVNEDTGNADDNRAIATEAQSESFELLAKNEDSIAQVAKTKKVTYGIATGLFGAGAIMATIEAFQLKAAYAQLAVPQTAVTAQATINRLTCGADPQGKSSTSSTSSTSATTSGVANGAGGAGGAVKNAVISGGVSAGINAGVSALQGAGSNQTDSSLGPAGAAPTTNEVPAPQECPEGSTYSASTDQCIQTSTHFNLNEILNLKIKTKAAQNIQHARNYKEMMELMAEINSLEFENYSRQSYYNGNPLLEGLSNLSFSKQITRIVSQSLVNSAQAQQAINLPNAGSSYTWTSSNPSPSVPANPNAVPTYTIDPNQASTPITIDEISPSVTKNNPQAGSQVDGMWNKMVYTPTGRLIFNGVLGGWMGIMTAHMSKQERISKERAELLRNLKAEFDSQIGIATCTSADRNDPAKPSCYCFNSDNRLNPARSNSRICNMEFMKLKFDLQGLANSPKVCVDQSFGIDKSCSCRQRKGADGKNTCMKVNSNFNVAGMNPGTFRMIGSVVGPANDIVNGNASVGSVDAGAIGSNAARVKAIADQSLAKNKAASKHAKDLEKSLLNATRGLQISGAGFSQGASLNGMTPKQASAALAKELEKKEDEGVQKAGATSGVAGAQTPVEEQPEFGLTEEQLAAQETEVAEVLSKDMDLGNNDINNSSSTNIFDVLSNRYQRSGMRRLFDESGKTKSDAPSKTDINQ